jgi:hypothetical protein
MFNKLKIKVKMKKIKFMLVALMAVFGFNNAMAAELVHTTQYGEAGYQYYILSMTKGTDNVWKGTVSVKKNDLAGTVINIEPTVTITVEGTVSGAACSGPVVFDIVEIEENGFAGLENVTSITFATDCKITTIGAGAFAGTKIANLDLTNTKITVLNKLFENANTALKTVVLPATLTNVSDYALQHCYALGSIDASKCTKLIALGKNCFGDNAVTTLDLSATIVEDLSNTPFVGKAGESGEKNKTLQHLVLPKGADGAPGSITEIGTGLANLYNLQDVNLKDTKIVNVPAGAFENDKSLTSLEFPKTLKNIRESNMFKGCESLATLRICYDALTAVGYGTNNFFVAASADDDKTESALKTLEFFTTSATTYDFKAYVGSSAFANCKGITTVKIAVGDDIAATAEFKAGTIALSNEEASTVQMGNLKNAPEAGFIVGPTATTVAATVTIGEVAAAQNQATGIVSGNIGTFTVGKISAALTVSAIGQAQTIVFSGDITTALVASTVANTRLTTINFGSVKIKDADGIIPAGAFSEGVAPLLTAVTWTPTIVTEGSDIYNPTNKIFAQNAFGTSVKDAAAKITFTTVPEIAALYPAGAGGTGNELDKNLFNVIFVFVPVDDFTAIKVYGPSDAVVYVGYFVAPTGTDNYYIEKKQGDAIITVYSAFVDDSDSKIYMDPLMIVDGKFVVQGGQVVVVRSTTSADVKAYKTTQAPTMRYPMAAATDPFNELQYTPIAISADELGTKYYTYGQHVYYLQNPTTATGINFAELGPTQYLFAKAVYVVKDGPSAGRLEVVWLDGTNDATAIQAIQNKVSASNDAIYNLAGQKVSASYKGVVIKNGKKYIQK